MNAILAFLQPLWSFLSQVILSAFPILNTAIVVGAGVLGMRLHGRFRTSARDIILRAVGIAVILFSINELWNSFFILEDGVIEAEGTLLAFISLPVGWLVGEALSIDRGLGKLGLFLHSVFEKPDASTQAKKTQLSPEETARLVLAREECATGFIIATTLSCFSSLIFTGFMEGRINGDPIPMLIKLAFDFLLIFWLATVYGSGVPFAAIPVLLSEGIMGISYSLWTDFFTPKLLGQLSIVGGAILLFGGISLCRGKRFFAAKLIPALFIPILYTSIMNRADEIAEESKSKK